MSKTSAILPPPTPIALVICDNIYEESGGKRALVGLFNQIFSATFPVTHFKLCVFVSITSLRIGTICKLDIANAETDQLVMSMQGPTVADNPTAVCDLVFELHHLTFPEAGVYYARFWGNEQILMQRAFNVVQMPPSLEQ